MFIPAFPPSLSQLISVYPSFHHPTHGMVVKLVIQVVRQRKGSIGVTQNKTPSELQPRSNNPASSEDSAIAAQQANIKFITLGFDSLKFFGPSQSSVF